MTTQSDLCVDFSQSQFSRCLINTLLTLSSSALGGLKALITLELTFVDAKLIDLIIQSEAADILGQQTTLLKNVVQAELNQIQSQLSSLPLGLLDQSCTDWATLNGGITGFLNNEIVPPISQILFELQRLVSMQSEIGALKSEYEGLKQYFLDVLDLLDEVILEAKCRENAA